jgi:hypothetical protein
MTIAQTSANESVREALNRADISVLADALRGTAFGDVLRGLPVYLRAVGVTATPKEQVSTLDAIVLPEDAKAAVLHRVTVRTATAAAGEFSIQAYGATPTTTQVAIGPNGDIVFLHTDAVTSVDVVYTPQKGDVLGNQANSRLGITSLVLSVATGIATIPAPYSGKAILLMQANATAGTVTGFKQILVPATAATAAGTAALSKDGTKVYCNNATDGVTSITVDLLVASGLVSTTQVPNAQGATATTDINTILEQVNGGGAPNLGLFT